MISIGNNKWLKIKRAWTRGKVYSYQRFESLVKGESNHGGLQSLTLFLTANNQLKEAPDGSDYHIEMKGFTFKSLCLGVLEEQCKSTPLKLKKSCVCGVICHLSRKIRYECPYFLHEDFKPWLKAPPQHLCWLCCCLRRQRCHWGNQSFYTSSCQCTPTSCLYFPVLGDSLQDLWSTQLARECSSEVKAMTLAWWKLIATDGRPKCPTDHIKPRLDDRAEKQHEESCLFIPGQMCFC